VLQKKPLITVLEPDASRGGLSRREIRELLAAKYASTRSLAKVSWAEKWGFENEVASWAAEWRCELTPPSVEAIQTALFTSPLIEWNRFSAFQDVTMRLIAVQVLKFAQAAAQAEVRPTHLPARLSQTKKKRTAALASLHVQGGMYVQGEAASQQVKPIPLQHRRTHHLYCSPSCKGATELADELGELTAIRWTDQLWMRSPSAITCCSI
jgi:hypothetical protein